MLYVSDLTVFLFYCVFVRVFDYAFHRIQVLRGCIFFAFFVFCGSVIGVFLRCSVVTCFFCQEI